MTLYFIYSLGFLIEKRLRKHPKEKVRRFPSFVFLLSIKKKERKKENAFLSTLFNWEKDVDVGNEATLINLINNETRFLY